MNLLPKTHTEFSTEEYWEKFFKKRGGKAFEWYGEYTELCGLIHKYIKLTEEVLVVGCGNSQLSDDMYDVGYEKMTNIDISDTVIKQMVAKNGKRRPKMTFCKMDLMKMDFEDNRFSVVLDKGTLDAIMVDDSESVNQNVDKMLQEIGRVLRLGGRYICVSLAQKHILNKVVKTFSDWGWPIRVHLLQQQEDKETAQFQMPVFVFVMMKFKKMPNMPQILEVSYFEDKFERLPSLNDLVMSVKEMQHYGIFRQSLSHRLTDEQISVDLHDPCSSVPRYTLHVVDQKVMGTASNKFAIFIVPQGRETEWLFSSDEGRIQLASSASYQRLVVVTLHREHTYTNIDTIKAELSTKVMELKPSGISNNAQVPFLSIGNDIGKRTVQLKGQSLFSGDFIVEDVHQGECTYRQLVFMTNKDIVQSQAKLLTVPKKKKKTEIDRLYLSCNHHHSMVAGLAYLHNNSAIREGQIKVMIVGLGGGGLATYLHLCFPQIKIDVVEIDEAMATVAKEWFNFQEDDKMKFYIKDGLDFIRECSLNGATYDVIMLDIDSKDSSVGMSSPPAMFVQIDFLTTIKSVLEQSGVFVMNLVCRDQQLRSKVIDDVKTKFNQVMTIKITEEVNEIIFACNSLPPEGAMCHCSEAIQKCLIELDDMVKSNVSSFQKTSGDMTSLVDSLKDICTLLPYSVRE